MFDLRHIIRTILLEEESRLTMYPEIGGYSSFRLERDSGNGHKMTYYNLRDENGHEIGTMGLDGNLRYRVDKHGNIDPSINGNYVDSGKNFSVRNGPNSGYLNVEQAVRWLYLKNQKPLNEESKWTVVKPKYKKIVYPDIDNWYAEVGLPSHNITVVIYDSDGHNVAKISNSFSTQHQGTYTLQYDNGTEDGKHYTDEVPWKYGEEYIKQAVRYVWLHRQKPNDKNKEVVSEDSKKAEFKNVPIGKLVTFSDVDGWGAEGRKWNNIGIYSNIGMLMGVLIYNETTKKTVILYGEDANGNWEHQKRWPFFGNVKQAVRYVWLRSQKNKQDISENSTPDEFPVGEEVTFPDIDNWSVMRSHYPGTIMIISSPDNLHVGTLHKYTEGDVEKSELGYDAIGKIGKQGWQHIIPWDFNKVKQAVRFVYLKNLKPKEEIVDEIKTDGKGDLSNSFSKNQDTITMDSMLNNDYVDNFLDAGDYYQNTKIAKSLPTMWEGNLSTNK